ncbi:hypothetical protein CMT41_07070 [Colwellia sp. MT41]|uniref:hypothetical protein n=1 Tax=Colwellia sp. MT41 TaxID=58049 RepID=UPI000717592F|nr:hypothetical protein [Colwellia sp. MT41]ALO34502.1 hypothetical protein CMT41_07070 [Colwellia sp. MT41]
MVQWYRKLYALIISFFSESKFVELEVKNAVLLHTEIGEDTIRNRHTQQFKEGLCIYRKDVYTSFIYVGLMVLLVISLGLFKGNLSLEYRFDIAKLSGFIGTFLASWATVIELGSGMKTRGGTSLVEVIRPMLFKCLFLPGVFLMLTGAVV